MKGVLQGLVSGLKLFGIFVGDTYSGIECTLRQFADDIRRCGVVNTQERRNAIQRDLGRLKSWASARPSARS